MTCLQSKRLPLHKQGPKAGEVWRYPGTRGRGFVVEKSAETRHVTDRTFGGDVIYVSGRFNRFNRSQRRCTLFEWRDWACEAKRVWP